MKDLGFGVIDQRTIIIFFVVLVLAQLFTGAQIPVDIQNPKNLFADLVLLTGYFYLARTIYRLPFTLLFSIPIVLSSTIDFFEENRNVNEKVSSTVSLSELFYFLQPSQIMYRISNPNLIKAKDLPSPFDGNNIPEVEPQKNIYILKIIKILNWILIILSSPIILLSNALFLSLTFGIWSEEKKILNSPFLDSPFWGIFDRVGVVIIAILAVVPQYKVYITLVGIGGLLVIILIFILRGNFSAVIGDNIKEKEEIPLKEKEYSRGSPMYVEVVNTDENPVSINNSQINPLYIENASIHRPIPVTINEIHRQSALPVEVVNNVQVSTPISSPLSVEIENYSPIPVEVINDVNIISSEESLPVKVTNIVTTQSFGEDEHDYDDDEDSV